MTAASSVSSPETHLSGRRVAVIGGGIGGLTVALACAQHGAQVTVYEQAPSIREFGAGLQITPNGARALEALGLGGALDAAGLRAQAVVPMDALSGRAVTRFDLSDHRDPPYRFIHRADLIAVLHDACRAAGGQVVLNARVHVQNDRAYVGDSAIEADLICGAGGLHSALRPLLNGVAEPFFTGQVAWRAVIDHDAPPEARIWMAPGKHVVTYPLPEGRLNIVAVQERKAWAAEGWNHEDSPSNLRHAFGGMSGLLTGVLAEVQQVRLWGLFRHPVARVWHRGNLALLGDAAHPTLPFLAQGANLAIEDAYTLAACCAAAPVEEALPRYQTLRRARVQRAISAANRNAVNYHLSGMRRTASHGVLRGIGRVAPGAFLGRMDWLYGYDVTQID